MQGARIRYTPTTAPEMGTETKRNMEVLLEADPAKSAGQGFGSAGQYLDAVSYTHLDVYKRQRQDYHYKGDPELFHRTGYRLWRLSAQYLQIQKGVQEKKSVWNK